MSYTLPELCDKILLILQQGTGQATMSGGLFSPERRSAAINSAYNKLNNLAASKRNQWLLDYFNATVDPTTNLLTRRLNSRNSNILAVTLSQNGDAPPKYDEFTAVLGSWKNGASYPNQVKYIPRGLGEVLITQCSAQVGQVFRVWYVRPFQPLHSGTLTAGTTTALTFPSTPSYGTLSKFDDAYKGDEVMIVGTGDTARVTAYAKSTRVATVQSLNVIGDPAFATNPGAVPYSMVPWFPENHHETLAWMAARMFSRVEQAKDFDGEIAARIRDFEQWLLAPDTASQPKRGTVQGNDYLGTAGPTQWTPWWYGGSAGTDGGP